jgi:hypothetical protein
VKKCVFEQGWLKSLQTRKNLFQGSGKAHFPVYKSFIQARKFPLRIKLNLYLHFIYTKSCLPHKDGTLTKEIRGNWLHSLRRIVKTRTGSNQFSQTVSLRSMCRGTRYLR